MCFRQPLFVCWPVHLLFATKPPMLFDLHRYRIAAIAADARRTLLLALPIMVAQVAQVGMGFVDTLMAGRVGTGDLAAVALGSNVFVTVFVTLMGVVAALNPILSQLFGAGKTEAVGDSGRQGLWFGLGLGIIGMLLLWLLIVPVRNFLGLGEYVENTFAQYVFLIALGMPGALLYRALHAYASSLNRTLPIMVVGLAALLLNIPLNYIFVYGKLGMPAMGGAGCGLASALVFWLEAVVLWLYIARHRYFAPFGLTRRFAWPQWRAQWQMLKLGVPIGLSFFLEVSLFTFIGLLISRFGVTQVAAQQVVISLTAILYMLPQSLGVALGVRVAQSVGMGKLRRARFVAGSGMLLGGVCSLLTIALLLIWRTPLVSMYTHDPAVIALSGTLLLFAAVFQWSDATQTIASYALRGYKLTKIPMLIHAVAFWGLGLGLGSLLGLYFNWGLYGFWSALVLALFGAAVALTGYLDRKSRRLAVRQGW